MRDIDDYFDYADMLVTNEGDGGDSAFFTGHYHLANYANTGQKYNEVFRFLDHLEKQPGLFVRHPDSAKWYSSLDRMSRDQMTPLIILMGYYRMFPRLKRAMIKWLGRGMFMQNTRRNGATRENHGQTYRRDGTRRNYNWKLPDWAPTFLSLYIRAFRSPLFYPLLYICDIELLLSALKKRIFGGSKAGDEFNFTSRLVQAQRSFPTPLSCWARRLYIRMPHHPEKKGLNALDSYLTWYCKKNSNKNPPIDIEYYPVVSSWYGNS